MSAHFRFRPGVEQLDVRSLPNGSFGGAGWLSAMPVEPGSSSHVIQAPVGQPGQAHSHVQLLGVANGTWSSQPSNPDVGTTQTLQGAGYFLSLGQVQVSGTLHTPGFILTGHTTGTLVLSNAKGTITLQLIGPPQPGFSPPPPVLHFTITGGTGAYTGATGQGTVFLQETPATAGSAGSFSMIFIPAGGQAPPPA